jgi:cell division septation protein DedD
MADSNHWQASLNEHRAAWIIACCSIGIIFLASTWPNLFSFKSTLPTSGSRQVETQTRTQQGVRFAAPKKQTHLTIKKQPKKTTATLDNYYVQAGAFKEKIRARKLVSRMKEHGWNAVIVPKSGFHTVWVGPKNSSNSIESLRKSIHRTLNIKGFIVQKKTP